MSRLGLAVPIEGLGFAESLALAVHAEQLGYTDAWSYEVCGSDGFSPLGWLAAKTTTLRLGISVIPAFTRSPALIAMSCASVSHLSGGRMVLGLGSSSPNVVERWMGGTYDRPLTRVRETTEALRLALGAEKVSYTGQTISVQDFRLALEPAPVPIMLGALGPRMYALAGAIGDGVVMVFTTAEATPAILAGAYEGARDAGRDPGALDVVAKLFVAVDEDLTTLGPMLRRLLVGYATVPAYNRLLVRQGFAEQAQAMAQAWQEGHRADALDAVSDELLHALFVCGSAQECRARVEAYRGAGVSTPLIAPITAEADPQQRRRRLVTTIEQLAR